jgi:hypothetical protein
LRFLFDFSFRLSFSAHLRLNLSPQPNLFFGPTLSFGLSLPSGFFFRAAALSFVSQQTGLFGGFHARIFAQAQPQNLFFDGGDARLCAAAQLVFLCSFASFTFQKPALFLTANAGLFGFHIARSFEFGPARSLSGGKLLLDFGAPRVFHGAHAFQFFFDASQFGLSNATAGLFGGTFACFRFDPQLLLLSATARGLFLFLSPSVRSLIKSMLGSKPGRFEFCTACFFFRAQPKQFHFELVGLFNDRGSLG